MSEKTENVEPLQAHSAPSRPLRGPVPDKKENKKENTKPVYRVNPETPNEVQILLKGKYRTFKTFNGPDQNKEALRSLEYLLESP